jgi:signal peptidase I
MSQSSFENGDHPAVVAGGQAPGVAATRAIAARSGAQELDHRVRGLNTEPTPPVSATPPRTNHHRRPLLAKVAVFAAVVALAVVLLRAFVIQPFALPGSAMAPTVQAGDRLLVLKLGLLQGSIRSGQIVVFHPPKTLPCTVLGGRARDLALRVVAVPGEAIWSVGNTIFVDGRPLREKGWYDPRFGQVGSIPIRSTTLAPGQYFVMADNRADACDSRVFGPISKSSVVGRAIARVGRHGHVSFGTV